MNLQHRQLKTRLVRWWATPAKSTPRWLLALGALAAGFYMINAVHYGNEPLRIEESEWPPMAEAIYNTAKPVIEYDQTHRLKLNPDLTVDETPSVGAWHPPLYLYTLATSMVFIGTDSPHLLRGVGVAGLFASIILLMLIAREVTPRWRLVGGIAAVLLLIHPFAIQGSLFLDIDPSVYAPPALLTIWLAIRYSSQPEPLRPAQVMAIGAAIALVIWMKMTTTIVLLAALVVWWLLTRRPIRRALIEAVSFVAAGMVLFFSTYALWCAATGVAFSYTFEVTFVGKSGRLLSEWWLVNNAAHWHLRWLGPAVALLALVYVIDLARHFLRNHMLRPMDLPFLVGVGTLVLYVLLSPTDGTYQGKYAFPALLMMMLPISWMLLRERGTGQRGIYWAAAAGIGVTAALALPDLLTGLTYQGDYGTWLFEFKVAAGTGAALLLAWWAGERKSFSGGVVLVLSILLIAQAIDSYRANTSPMYPIPDTADFMAAVDDLNTALKEDDIAVVPKDLGFYVEHTVIEGEDAFVRGDGRLVAAIKRYPQIKAFARDSFGPPIGPKTEELLSRCFGDERTYGTATILYRTSNCD